MSLLELSRRDIYKLLVFFIASWITKYVL